jgi:glycerol transport system ATP-binding protein
MPTTQDHETHSLELDGLTQIRDNDVRIADVNLRFDPRSFTVLLGRTRAGKTSLLRLIAGLERPSAGRIRWGGVDVTARDVRSRDVAMVYQQFVNYPSLTVYENIASPLRIQAKLGSDEIDRRVRETAARLRLDGLLHRLPAELSGGQQQRTAVARALAKGASVILFDEPLASLDYKLREELRAELRALLEDGGRIVIYATAEPAEAMAMGGRIAVMDEGRIVQLGPALEVYAAPATQRVAQVMSDPEINLLDVDVTPDRDVRLGEDVTFALSDHLRDLPPGRYRFGIRANHVRLVPSSSSDICLPSAALLEEISGSETRLHAACGSCALTALIPGVHRHALGTPLQLFVAPERIFAFDFDGRLLHAAQKPSLTFSTAAHGTH